MKQYAAFISHLKEIVGCENLLVDELMKNHTSFKVGGPADILITPQTYEGVQKSIEFCQKNNMPYCIIGNGSNLIVKDGGIRGVVIKLTKLDKISVEGNRLTAQCGVLLSDASKEALNKSLTGLEFACGIPGCIGGAVAMNAGAYIGEIKDVIHSALVVDESCNIKRLFKNELELSYRNSAILKYGYTVLEAVFELSEGNSDSIKEVIDDLQRKRTEKQPLEYPSAGSTFKRPEGHFAGQLIQEAGLKGVSIGGAQVSEKHSGFIINTGNSTARDILDLIQYVQKRVYDKFGVELHTEVRILGED